MCIFADGLEFQNIYSASTEASMYPILLCTHLYICTYIEHLMNIIVCRHYIPYVAKFSRPKNFANRFQKGGAEIFATKIFAKAALIHCVIL